VLDLIVVKGSLFWKDGFQQFPQPGDIPFIVLSGVVREEAAVELMRSGAADYVEKRERLGAAVYRALKEARRQLKLRQTEEALQKSGARIEEKQRELQAQENQFAAAIQENILTNHPPLAMEEVGADNRILSV